MADSFGARLRRKREEQDIALAAIAADTKIKLSLLEGLERDDVSGWPSGIFRRAYVRAYARALHLAADEVVAEFVATYPEPDTSDVPLSACFPKSAEADTWRERIWQFGRRTIPPEASGANAPAAAAETPAIADTRPLEDVPAQSDHGTLRPAAPVEAAAPEPLETPAPIASDEPPADAPAEAAAVPPFEPDLDATAKVCTDLSQVSDASDLMRALEAAAGVLNASGVIVWLWDRSENHLIPAFAHGYSTRVLERLQGIPYDADNATAAAFRSADVIVVKRTGRQNGALVAPLMRAGGCIGVLAIEILEGAEETPSIGHVARIVAAQLATLFDASMAGAAAEPAVAAR